MAAVMNLRVSLKACNLLASGEPLACHGPLTVFRPVRFRLQFYSSKFMCEILVVFFEQMRQLVRQGHETGCINSVSQALRFLI